MNVYFLVSIPHPKGGNIIWTCVKYNITKEKDQCKAIGLLMVKLRTTKIGVSP